MVVYGRAGCDQVTTQYSTLNHSEHAYPIQGVFGVRRAIEYDWVVVSLPCLVALSALFIT